MGRYADSMCKTRHGNSNRNSTFNVLGPVRVGEHLADNDLLRQVGEHARAPRLMHEHLGGERRGETGRDGEI